MRFTCDMCGGKSTIENNGATITCPQCSGAGHLTAEAYHQLNAVPEHVLTGFPFDDEGHYQTFNAIYGTRAKYVREMGWLTYHDGFWDRDLADKHLSNWITDVLRRRGEATHGLKGRMADKMAEKCAATRGKIEAIKAIAKDRLLASVSAFNTEPHLINCANGVLDLRTLTLSEHRPAHFFSYRLTTDWNPDADVTEWNEFAASCVGDTPENFSDGISALELLQLTAGYSLTGDTTAETMFYVFGPPRSGKGTFMTAVQNLMGPLSNTVNIGTLTSGSKSDGQNFELAGLSACRYITVAETGRDTYLDAGRVKNLTGNDPIQCAFKFKDSFRYTPKFKIWVSSNHEVNLDAGDDAVWDRLRAFHFATSHKDNPDTALKRRLTQGKGLEAVLLWCAQGAQAWYQLQEQGKPMPRTEAMKQYLLDRKDEADYIKQFLEASEIKSSRDEKADCMSVSDLYGKFKSFCAENHIDKFLSLRNFVADLKRRGFVYTQRKIMGKNARVVLIETAPLGAEVAGTPF